MCSCVLPWCALIKTGALRKSSLQLMMMIMICRWIKSTFQTFASALQMFHWNDWFLHSNSSVQLMLPYIYRSSAMVYHKICGRLFVFIWLFIWKMHFAESCWWCEREREREWEWVRKWTLLNDGSVFHQYHCVVFIASSTRSNDQKTSFIYCILFCLPFNFSIEFEMNYGAICFSLHLINMNESTIRSDCLMVQYLPLN